jgi:gag-polyprotein putative aspartyl protease
VKYLHALGLTVFVLGAISQAQAACKLEQVAEFHVERVAGAPIIDGQINGHPIRILLETGTTSSSITQTAAHQMGLPLRWARNETIEGVDGQRMQFADIKELRIGQFLLEDSTINVIRGEIHDGNGVANSKLGAAFFARYTTEFDLSRGVVRLLRPKDCKLEQLVYWSPTYLQVDLQHFSTVWPLFKIGISVNGKPQQAALMSGSATSYITPYAAREAGVEPTSPGVEPAEPYVRAGETPIPTWIGRFDTVEFGAETIKNARLHIGYAFPPWGVAWKSVPYEVIFGSDFFQAHRIMIVPDQRVVLLTYNGGAVF